MSTLDTVFAIAIPVLMLGSHWFFHKREVQEYKEQFWKILKK